MNEMRVQQLRNGIEYVQRWIQLRQSASDDDGTHKPAWKMVIDATLPFGEILERLR